MGPRKELMFIQVLPRRHCLRPNSQCKRVLVDGKLSLLIEHHTGKAFTGSSTDALVASEIIPLEQS